MKKNRQKIFFILVAILALAALCCFLKAWSITPVPLAGISICDIKTERWLKDGYYLKKEFQENRFHAELSFSADAKEQEAAIERFLRDGAKILVIAANDTTSLAPILKKAARARSKVIAYDRLIQNSPDVQFLLTFNSQDVGSRMAEHVLNRLPADRKSAAKILLIGGAFNDSNTGFLHKGVMRVLRPEIKTGRVVLPEGGNLTKIALSEWEADLAVKRMEHYLSKHGMPDAVICYSDELAKGVIQVLNAKGRGKKKFPIITGQDGTRDAIRFVLDGKQSMTVFKDPRILAKQTAKIAGLLLKNAPLPHTETVENGAANIPVIYSPVQPVTKENCRSIMFDSNYYTPDLKESFLPNGFVYVDEIIPDAVCDLRYATENNFTGGKIDGYLSPRPILTEEAARALAEAANEFRRHGYRIRVYDAYRPRKAVAHFFRWLNDPNDSGNKNHYPNLTKEDILKNGYLDEKSAHSRGSTVDLSLVDKSEKPLDMGGSFDLFDRNSHHEAKSVTPEQKKNRAFLRTVMTDSGFLALPREWWHYSLAEEPYPDTSFDFDVK